MIQDKIVEAQRPHPFPGDQRNGKLLSVSEAADMMNAHPNSVRRWADLGLLQTYRIGLRGDRRFKAHDINAFLESSNGYSQKDPPNGHHT